jgi:hypothetical protein
VDSEAAGTKTIVSEMGVVALMAKPNDAFNKAFVEAIKAHRHWAGERRKHTRLIPFFRWLLYGSSSL